MKWIVVVSLGALLASCAGRGKIVADEQTKAALGQGQTVEVITYGPPGTKIVAPPTFIGDPISMLLGAVIHGANTPSGTAPGPVDASKLFTDEVVKRYLTPRGVTVTVNGEEKPGLPPDPETYKGSSKSNYILEVWWPPHAFYYGSMAWSTYYYVGGGQARLIENGTGKVVWRQWCDIDSKLGSDDPKSLSLDKDEFTANEGRRVNEIIEYAVQHCVAKLPATI